MLSADVAVAEVKGRFMACGATDEMLGQWTEKRLLEAAWESWNRDEQGLQFFWNEKPLFVLMHGPSKYGWRFELLEVPSRA